MKLKVHHIAFTVENLEESINWYEEKLQFKLISKHKSNDVDLAILELGEIRIELFNFGNETKQLPDYRKELMSDLKTIGTKHLCLQTEDLENTIQKLKEKGVDFITDIDNASFGGKYIFFKDCNGILIELIQV
ncbi:MAG: VOC family protein [Candidatus Levybacteria bacterium]|nr:VOC family protein [Candidatus Levybacteria bacterium]